MKPIIRWNVGPVSHVGFECLNLSYRNAKKLFGDSVEFIVCHNTLLMVHPLLKEMEGDGVRLVDATGLITEWLSDDGTMATTGNQKSGWVFAPLQNDVSRKELILDNDILIYRRNPVIDDWLFSDGDEWLFMQHWRYANKRSEVDRRRICFGALRGLVPARVVRIDGGMVGVPPGDKIPVVRQVLDECELTSDMFIDHVWEQAVLSLLRERVRDNAVLLPFGVIPRAFKKDFEVFDETWAVHLSGLNQLVGKTWSLLKYKEFVKPYVVF